MKFPRSSGQELELNLTPLIDIVFLLLIFFMVSTTFIQKAELSITLPEASGRTAPDRDKRQVEITVTQNGQYRVNSLPLADGSLAGLMRAIDEAAGGDRAMRLVVAADARTAHQSVVLAMDAARQLGYSRLSITTRNSRAKDL